MIDLAVNTEQPRLMRAEAVDDIPAPTPVTDPIEMRAKTRDHHGMEKFRVHRRDNAEPRRRHHQRHCEDHGIRRRVLESDPGIFGRGWCVAVGNQGEIQSRCFSLLGEADMVLQVEHIGIALRDGLGGDQRTRIGPEYAEAHRVVAAAQFAG